MKTRFWIIYYNHKHGADVWPDWSDDEPSESDIIEELEAAGSLDEGEIDRIDTYVEIRGPFYVPGRDPRERKLEPPVGTGKTSRRGEIAIKVLEYINDNIKGGVRTTNIESMAMAIEVSTSDPLYMEMNMIVADLIRAGELTTWTEEWRDFCWLIPKDFDHIAMFPDTRATVRCKPFGFGYPDPGDFDTPTCPRCRINKLSDWADDECSYCTEAREEGKPMPGSTGP